MPKRKRSSSAEAASADEAMTSPPPTATAAASATHAPDGAKQQRVQHKLKQGAVKIGHAFKLAKGFERQKLGRRQKSAGAEKKEQDIQRINAEIAALKTLDTTSAGRHHLYKTLTKIKAVAASPDLPSEVLQQHPLSTDSALLNVHARLCNSNPVKQALPAVLADVQNALGIMVDNGKAIKKKRLRAKDYEHAESAWHTVQDDKKSLHQVWNPGSAPNESESAGDDETEMRRAGMDRDSSGDFEHLDHRLASSGGEDSDKASHAGDNIDDLERQLAAEGFGRSKTAAKTSYDHTADLSLSEEDPEPSPSPEPQKAPAPKKTTFIPSLTMGGYVSGSGSDPESDIDVAPKKNRRGQRARQALWEKKFGQKAKHLQKTSRNAGWDPKRGATDGTERKPGQKPGMVNPAKRQLDREHTFANRRDGGHASKKHKDDQGPIHPSWEAAKKAKEKKEGGAAFAGKKITFD
ncbi:hypothetical protein D0864_12053 [Hortaea werneckii]|uniref:Bud22 domain-containing protein n=1 Tax=Hortaea werneckii TaxID=91943 RepID=A0A3M7DN06_HORWE|nr:hypothetical protein KC352_g30916 [Hortaea werneckii]KAI7617352.1 hypothetical protein KC346_g5527 [Hortaea werneckii]KAI7705994.1 hypothetical protein KC322_g6051 [Hortaea werneckii]RMY65584.1 hypothetical protein D0864_12053 [Hortaea werneckii]